MWLIGGVICSIGCATELNTESNPSWVRLNEPGEDERRQWSQTSLVPADVKAKADALIEVLNRRRGDHCSTVRLGVIGDTRAAFDGLGVSVFFRPMLEEMASRKHELILHVGDLVKNGRQEEEWFKYAMTLEGLPPVIAVRGNHDRGQFFYDGRFANAPVFIPTMGCGKS